MDGCARLAGSDQIARAATCTAIKSRFDASGDFGAVAEPFTSLAAVHIPYVHGFAWDTPGIHYFDRSEWWVGTQGHTEWDTHAIVSGKSSTANCFFRDMELQKMFGGVQPASEAQVQLMECAERRWWLNI